MNNSRRHTWMAFAACGALTLAACGPKTFQGQVPLVVPGNPPAPPAPPAPEPPKPKPRVELRDNKIEITEKIQFEHAKANIKEESHSLLNEIVDVIQKNPQLKEIAIEGHASSEGNADFNRRLSDDRAKAVRAYLVSKGIPEKMLTAKGYGADKPIASNDTEQGREKNRRVEFNVTKQDVTQKKVEIDPTTGKERVVEERTVSGSEAATKKKPSLK